MTLSSESLPRVILKPRRAQPFFARHPWVFSGAVARVEGEPAPGAEVALVTEHGEFVALGAQHRAHQLHGVELTCQGLDVGAITHDQYGSCYASGMCSAPCCRALVD